MAEYPGWGAGRALSETQTLSPADDASRRRAARAVVAHALDVDEARALLAMLGLDTLRPRGRER